MSEAHVKRLAQADGYRGIWYFNQKTNDEYVYKYSGGLGTYCAKHIPLASYVKEVNRTFFVYGGTAKEENRLVHMVSFYDHETGTVPRPRILLDKQTSDAHDNPVIMLDDVGHIWIFSSAHGAGRPAFIHRSVEPYSIDAFELTYEGNYSYPQPWHLPGNGFLFLHTNYNKIPDRGIRQLFQTRSPDGYEWEEPRPLACIEQGHYQVSWRHRGKVGTAFNHHPDEIGLNVRTNLYYMETDDFGETWHAADGTLVDLPIASPATPALVHDFAADKKLVYMKDLNFDADGNPIILVITAGTYRPGPAPAPRTWTTARWTGDQWDIRPVTESDNAYDTGCLHVEADGSWRIIGPTETGPQPYNPGGEMALWTSNDQGRNWIMVKQLTRESEFNHTYARKPVNAHPDFYALWADGHGRRPSASRIYICDRDGNARRLPFDMKSDVAEPEPLE